jgi:hypothetical protein
MDHKGVVIEAQVDWLTCSVRGEDRARNLADLGQRLAQEEKALGNRPHRWRSMGYEGTHVGRAEYGWRDRQSSILRLSGDLASRALTDGLSAADYVTRLDIAVTWRADPPDPTIGRNTLALAELFRRSHPRSALPSYHGDMDGGYTFNLGKRRSAYYFRLYNKEAECIATDDGAGAERYRGCWRYELEVKGPMALPLAERVDAEDDRPSYVQQYIYQWLQAHGIEPPFGEHGPRRLLPGFRRRSDADSKLAHLARNVRPTVDWLREQGREADLREVLGFEHPSEA